MLILVMMGISLFGFPLFYIHFLLEILIDKVLNLDELLSSLFQRRALL